MKSLHRFTSVCPRLRGLDVSPRSYTSKQHDPAHLPSPTSAVSCHLPHTPSMSFYLCPYLFAPRPSCLCMPTPSHLHPYVPHVQTILVSPGTLYQTPTIPSLFLSSSLEFLSFRVTPHIHFIIIFSALSRRCMSSNFIVHVSLQSIYHNALDTCTTQSSFHL